MQRNTPYIDEKRHFLSVMSNYFSTSAIDSHLSNVSWEKQGFFCCFQTIPDGIYRLRNLVGTRFPTNLSDDEIERRFQEAKQILCEKHSPYTGWFGERSATTQDFYDHFFILLVQIGPREEKTPMPPAALPANMRSSHNKKQP